MLAVLPAGWFSDPAVANQPATLLQATLSGLGTAWAGIFTLITTVRSMARIATLSGPFLDLASVDFFGNALPRRPGESDIQFRVRVQQALLRPRGTRAALTLALAQLTGRTPVIFEPGRPADTGGYSCIGLWYGIAGGWGNLMLNHTSFVTAFRPAGEGIAEFAGYGTGGYSYYGDLSMVATPVTDSDIYAVASSVLPAGHTAWMRIEG